MRNIEKARKAADREKRRQAALVTFKKLAADNRPAMTRAFIQWREATGKALISALKANPPSFTATIDPAAAEAQADRYAARLLDWDKLEEKARKIFEPIEDKVFRDGYKSVFIPVKKDILTDAGEILDDSPQTLDAIAYSKVHTGELVVEITGQQRRAITAYVRPALLSGRSSQLIAKDLRSVVGLNSRLAAALANYTTDLYAQGLSEDMIDKLSKAKANQLLNYRTLMIARTETSFALNSGIRKSYAGHGIDRLEYVADPEEDPAWTCDCREHNGKVYTQKQIDSGEAPSIPQHPNCECTWIAAEDAVAEAPAAIPQEGGMLPFPEGQTIADIIPMVPEKDWLNEYGLVGLDKLKVAEKAMIEDALRALMRDYTTDVKYVGTATSKLLKESSLYKDWEKRHLTRAFMGRNASGLAYDKLNAILFKGSVVSDLQSAQNINAFKTGWHLSKDRLDIVRHEYGHLYDFKWNVSKNTEFRKGIDEFCNKYGSKNILSEYAGTRAGVASKYSEQWAEMFSAYAGPDGLAYYDKISPEARKELDAFMKKMLGMD